MAAARTLSDALERGVAAPFELVCGYYRGLDTRSRFAGLPPAWAEFWPLTAGSASQATICEATRLPPFQIRADGVRRGPARQLVIAAEWITRRRTLKPGSRCPLTVRQHRRPRSLGKRLSPFALSANSSGSV